MEISQLSVFQDNCRVILENAIANFVKENGEDATDYDIDVFGLDDEDGTVTKVWNFYDNGGCYFFEPSKLNMDGLEDMDDENYYDKLYQFVDFTAYQCLYIVIEDGVERLKYYRFTHGGVTFDDDQAEPDHDYVSNLPLPDLDRLIEGIRLISK